MSVGSSEDTPLGKCIFGGSLTFNAKQQRYSGTGEWACFPKNKGTSEPAGRWFAACTLACWESPRISRTVR